MFGVLLYGFSFSDIIFMTNFWERGLAPPIFVVDHWTVGGFYPSRVPLANL